MYKESVKTLVIDNEKIKCTMINDLDFGRFIITSHTPGLISNRYTMSRERKQRIRTGESIIFNSDKNGNIIKTSLLIDKNKFDLFYEEKTHKDFPYIYDFGISIIRNLDLSLGENQEIQNTLKSNGINWILSYNYYEQIFIQIPELRKTTQKTMITSVKEFLSAINTIKNEFKSDKDIFYRGHAYFLYPVAPSLYRGKENYYENEKKIVSLFTTESKFFSDKSAIQKLSIMQHYGLPTRLLDITKNELVALFFACTTNPELRGEVFAFDICNEDICTFESPQVTILSNLYNLTYEEQSKLYDDVIKGNLHTEEWKKLLTYAQKDNNHAKTISEEILTKNIYIEGNAFEPRIAEQEGGFIIFGLPKKEDIERSKMMVYGETEYLIKWLYKSVYVCNKTAILKELNTLGINKESLFPDLSANAEQIKKKINTV